jgi:hypothetical protein
MSPNARDLIQFGRGKSWRFQRWKPCTARKTAPKNDDPTRFLPVGVRKSYSLLSKADRDFLKIALGKYQPAKSQPILVGCAGLLKPALLLLTLHRLRNRRDTRWKTCETSFRRSLTMLNSRRER